LFGGGGTTGDQSSHAVTGANVRGGSDGNVKNRAGLRGGVMADVGISARFREKRTAAGGEPEKKGAKNVGKINKIKGMLLEHFLREIKHKKTCPRDLRKNGQIPESRISQKTGGKKGLQVMVTTWWKTEMTKAKGGWGNLGADGARITEWKRLITEGLGKKHLGGRPCRVLLTEY